MNGLFANEFTGTDMETAKSRYGGHEHEQRLKLHSGCSGTAWHGAVDVENSSHLGHPILGEFHLLGEHVGGCLSMYFVS